MAQLSLCLLTSSLGFLQQNRKACLPEPKCSLSVCHCCPPAVSPWCWSSLSMCPYGISCALPLWLVGGKEPTGLMRDGLGQQWAMRQRWKRALGVEGEWWKPWAQGCEMWTWCRHLVGSWGTTEVDVLSVRPVSNFSSDILGMTWVDQQAFFFFILPEIILLHSNLLTALGQAREPLPGALGGISCLRENCSPQHPHLPSWGAFPKCVLCLSTLPSSNHTSPL